METLEQDLIIDVKSNYELFLTDKENLLKLVISDLTDKKQYDLIKENAKGISKALSAIESKRKNLKEESLNYGRKLDAAAKEISKPLQEIKDHLDSQVKAVDDFEINERNRKAKELNDRLETLRNRFIEAGASFNPMSSVLYYANSWSLAFGLQTATMTELEIIEHIATIRKLVEVDSNLRAENEKQRLEIERLNAIALSVEAEQVPPPPFSDNDLDDSDMFSPLSPKGLNEMIDHNITASSFKSYNVKFTVNSNSDFMNLLRDFAFKNQLTYEVK